MNMKNEGIKGL